MNLMKNKFQKINKKGLGLIELMICLFVLGLISLGIMKKTDLNLKIRVHQNQKKTADLFIRGLKDILTSTASCSNTFKGIDLNNDTTLINEIKTKDKSIMYKTSSSSEEGGKSTIDNLLKIKEIKMKPASDKKSLSLQLKLEKINPSFAFNTFTRTIDQIPVNTDSDKKVTHCKGSRVVASTDNTDDSGSCQSGNVVLQKEADPCVSTSKAVLIKDLIPEGLKNKEIKTFFKKINFTSDTYCFCSGQIECLDGSSSLKSISCLKKDNVLTRSSVLYSLESKSCVKQNIKTENCSYNLKENLTEGASKDIYDTKLSEEGKKSIKFSITTREILGIHHGGRIGDVGYIRKPFGSFINNHSSTTANLIDFLGIYYENRHIYFYAEQPLIDQVKKIKVTKLDGSIKEYTLSLLIRTSGGKSYKSVLREDFYFRKNKTYDIELISGDSGFSRLAYYRGTANVKCQNGKLIFTRPPVCDTYTCTGSKSASSLNPQTGLSFGIPGQKSGAQCQGIGGKGEWL